MMTESGRAPSKTDAFGRRFDLWVCYALMWLLPILLLVGGERVAAVFWLVGIMVGRKLEMLDPARLRP